jgi:hypothetical protein
MLGKKKGQIINNKTANKLSVYYVRCVEKTGELLKELSQNDFWENFQYWKARTERCVASK